MMAFNASIQETRFEHCPEIPGDKCRPTLYITASSLCHQAASELAKFSHEFRVVHIGGNANIAQGYTVSPTFPLESSSVWDTNDTPNLRRLYVVSYNYLAKHHGPQAYWAAVASDWRGYCAQRNIPFGGGFKPTEH